MNFTDLKSAFKFKRTCPYCETQLEIRSKKHVGKVMSSQVPEVLDGKVYFEIDQGCNAPEEFIVLDIKTGKVSKKLGPNSFFNKYYCSLRLECMNCFQYFHSFNLVIDISNCKLIECLLDAVNIKRILGKYEFTLNSSKKFNKTILTKIKLYDMPFPPSEDTLDWSFATPKDVEFPYVEIDLDNPDKTIERLDDLLLYI